MLCLSTLCSIAMKNHCDHDNYCILLYEKIFIWRLANSFRGLIHDHGRKHSSMQEDSGAIDENYIIIYRQRKKRDTKPGVPFWNLKAHYSQWHTLFNKITPLYPFIPIKYYHSLITKHLNIMEVICVQTTIFYFLTPIDLYPYQKAFSPTSTVPIVSQSLKTT